MRSAPVRLVPPLATHGARRLGSLGLSLTVGSAAYVRVFVACVTLVTNLALCEYPCMSDRLTGLDTSFLHLERDGAHMHVASTAIFEGPTPEYRDFVDHLASRLHLHLD